MKELGYGRDYVNPHREVMNPALIKALPPKLVESSFYRPTENGYEATIRQRLSAREKLYQQNLSKKESGGRKNE
jgi:replication-associated recombination protein RarA